MCTWACWLGLPVSSGQTAWLVGGLAVCPWKPLGAAVLVFIRFRELVAPGGPFPGTVLGELVAPGGPFPGTVLGGPDSSAFLPLLHPCLLQMQRAAFPYRGLVWLAVLTRLSSKLCLQGASLSLYTWYMFMNLLVCLLLNCLPFQENVLVTNPGNFGKR